MITATLTDTSSSQAAGVRLDELAAGQWRAVSTRIPESDPRAILGFVCATAGLFEVTVLSRPLELTFCGDLPAVHAVLGDDDPESDLPATEPITTTTAPAP